MELWQYYRILRRRKWLIIIGTLITAGIVLGVTTLRSQKWEAYTTVMEQTPGEQGGVNIFANPQYMVDYKLRLANLAQLVKSRTVMERAASTLASLGQVTSTEEIYELLNTIEASPLLDSTLLVISIKSDSQEKALATADAVAVEFIRFYNELNFGGVSRSKQFIEQELPRARARLLEIQEQLRKYKEESGAVMLSRQSDSLVSQATQIQNSIANASILAGQAAARIKALEQQLENFPETRTSATTIASNPIWQALQKELADQEIEMQRMLRMRTPEHPDVKSLQKVIDTTRTKLMEVGETIMNSRTETVDPIRDQVTQNYIQALVEHSAAVASQAAGQQVLSSLQPELQSLPEKEMRLAQLTLEEDGAKNTYFLLRQKYDEAVIREKEAENVNTVQIVDEAKARPADTRRNLKIALALILSPVFMAGIAFLLNYLDNTVKTPAEAEELLKLPVFAVVPMTKRHSLADSKQLPAIGSSYQMLSANLLIGQPGFEGKGILVASAEPDVGRSTTAANLAVTLARDGARVILVDSDLRQPSQHKIFGISNERGLSNVLAGQLPLEDALVPTSVNDLLVLPSGPLPSNPVRLFRSAEMSKFVSAVNELADFVVFDSPAGITFADASLLAALVKNVVIVHAAGTVPRGAEEEFRNRLEQTGANMIGAVLNMVRPEDSHGYYHFRSAYEDLLKASRAPSALAGSSSGQTANGEGGDDTPRG